MTDPGEAGDAAFGHDQVVQITESAVNPFCVIDLTGTVLWAGESIVELLGWSADELVGRSMIELVAPSSLDDALSSLGAATDYISSRSEEASTWEGIGPVVELVRADGAAVRCAIAVATPVRTGLTGLVLQLRRAESDSSLEDALVAMGRGDSITTVLGRVGHMLAGELPAVDVVVAHRCTDDGHNETIGAPAGRGGIFEPGALAGTPWFEATEALGTVVDHPIDDLPELFLGAARAAGYRWLTALGIDAAGPGRARSALAIWSRHPYASHVFSQQRLHRAAGLVGLVVQWEEGRRALEWAATHDVLTGLPNRSSFVTAINGEATDGATAVLYLDLDDFKPVNDQHGHALGDRVLALVATRLRHGVRPTDMVARLGGDEFAVLCPAIGDLGVAGGLADRLVESVSRPMTIDDIEVQVGLSIGIAALVEGDGPDEVLDRADEALREAKASGKHQWVAH
ncbi:MAG: diguanylate cyclase domain-containing protein [Acidimicrobiales bacterium]